MHYMLEIDILRNSSLKKIGCPEGWILRVWVSKKTPLTPCWLRPGVKGYLIYPFMASAPDDHSFYHLPMKNTSKVVKLTHSWLEHHNAIHLTLYHP